jgi:hypothetical protein
MEELLASSKIAKIQFDANFPFTIYRSKISNILDNIHQKEIKF